MQNTIGRWTQTPASPLKRRALSWILACAASLVVAALVWQGVTFSGNPDPTLPHLSRGAAIMNAGLLVFREGLEAILVMAALTASLVGGNGSYRRPIAQGAGLAFAASIVTWFAAIGLLRNVNASQLHIQAATGLLAIAVLLVIMNWFFHKIYWTGWIKMHNAKRRSLMEDDVQGSAEQNRTYMGLLLLGFSAMYREGFEVVLFLQSLRLRSGSGVVGQGVLVGLLFTGIVGALTFVVNQKLPYKKMLILTGILLAGVLVVMVGESVQEMQLAGWLSTTPVHLPIPAWMGLWFAVFPNVESLVGQAFAGVFVVGSYFVAEHLRLKRPLREGKASLVSTSTSDERSVLTS